jgi:EAL domain-containing protein (putative c-di-GMP-specific phosphodiesterase class I)
VLEADLAGALARGEIELHYQPRRRLELEITESLLVRDAEHTRGVLAALRTQGVRIVMDDFGTGYASLAQLRDFPFEKIKMDRSFAADLGARRRGSAAMVGAVVDIAAALGAETVAEGVETRAQFAAVAAAGCHHAQGWLLGRPMPIGLAAAQVQAVEAGKRLASSGVEWQRRAQ